MIIINWFTKLYLIAIWLGDLRFGIMRPSRYFGIFDLFFHDKHLIDSGQRGLDNIVARYPTKPVLFVGWIYGNKSDDDILRNLGVRGKMIWKQSDNKNRQQPYSHTKNGIFEQCIITMETAKILRDNYPAFPPQTFTGIDIEGNRTVHQPLWKGEYD